MMPTRRRISWVWATAVRARWPLAATTTAEPLRQRWSPPTGLAVAAGGRRRRHGVLDRRERRDRVPGRSGPDRTIPATSPPSAAAWSPAPASTTPASRPASSTATRSPPSRPPTPAPSAARSPSPWASRARRSIPLPETSRRNRTLFADTLYTLSGYVKVQDGATLTIEAGTTIVGDTAAAAIGSSLWILRGAKIEANGHRRPPPSSSPPRGRPGNRKPGDWGGIIIIGNGTINRTGGPSRPRAARPVSRRTTRAAPTTTTTAARCGTSASSSPGYDVSNGAGQELNTLSSYAVGRGTTYEYIESMAGLDDSFEYWGGAVDGRYLVSYESGDDHFDWTEGYRGRNQFLIAFQNNRLAPGSWRRRRVRRPARLRGRRLRPGRGRVRPGR